MRGAQLTNELAVLHTDTMKWAAPAVRGAALPAPRRLAAAGCSRDKLFVFGGEGAGGALLADLWALNLETMLWSAVAYLPGGGGAGRAQCAPRQRLGNPSLSWHKPSNQTESSVP